MEPCVALFKAIFPRVFPPRPPTHPFGDTPSLGCLRTSRSGLQLSWAKAKPPVVRAKPGLGDSQEPPECGLSESCLLRWGRRASLTHSRGEAFIRVQSQAGWQEGWPREEGGTQDTRQWVGRKTPIPEESRAMWAAHVGPPVGQACSV